MGISRKLAAGIMHANLCDYTYDELRTLQQI